ncbi:hypothetical protein OG613_47905 (plasmid) [Streptomyces sp. NBC_00015]|uniref:hypothetical protein n=1 Tax=Streptomyces sp. NBC_00015 TaxID=2903611 RepID=UPI002F914B5B
MTDVLTHPEAAQLVDSLVASGGGLVSYAFGAPGRQIAAAAGARLAADSGTSLTVVDFRHLLPQMRSVVDEVRPGLACTVISAGEAVQQPRNTEGVLVVHAEVLHDPRTREALLAMAATADSLVVASSDGFDEPALDDLAIPRFVFRPGDLMSPVPQEPPPRPRLREREPAPPHEVPSSRRDLAAPAGERGQRLLRQAGTEAESGQETVNDKELDDLVQNSDPDELSRRIGGIRDQQRQRAADHPAPALAPGVPAARDHGQEQAAAHQQHRPQGPGRT